MNFIAFFLIVVTYAFIGSVIGTRHHTLATRKCKYRDGRPNNRGGTDNCWRPGWCGHLMASVWLFGVMWWLALPIAMGSLIGSHDKASRVEKRRAGEIAEAEHRAELARIAREEDENLDRRLAALEKGRRR